MTEKDVKEKEVQNEIDPKLQELIEVMKIIDREMPNAEKEERISVFIEYMREKKPSNFGVKQNPSNTNEINLVSLVNALSFKQAKNGKSEFANIDKDLGSKLPQRFDYGGYNYFNKGDAIIRVKNNSNQ